MRQPEAGGYYCYWYRWGAMAAEEAPRARGLLLGADATAYSPHLSVADARAVADDRGWLWRAAQQDEPGDTAAYVRRVGSVRDQLQVITGELASSSMQRQPRQQRAVAAQWRKTRLVVDTSSTYESHTLLRKRLMSRTAVFLPARARGPSSRHPRPRAPSRQR